MQANKRPARIAHQVVPQVTLGLDNIIAQQR
jgi:hypothetical protein